VSGVFWTEARIELARAAYVDRRLGAARTAAVVGDGCTPRRVTKLVHRLGWAGLVPAEIRAAQRRSQIAQAGALGVAARQAKAAARPAPPRPRPRLLGVSADDAALIAEAVAAGRVRVLPPGRAAGLSLAETQFWAARAPGQRFNGGYL
jgi:hypothetical protein